MGKEPSQTQQGFDQAGNRVPIGEAWEIVTTTEPEWDDRQRDKMLALALYRADLCPDCRYPMVMHDPRYHIAVEVGQCPIKAGLDRMNRILGDADERARKQSKAPANAPDPADGRQVSTRLKPPS